MGADVEQKQKELAIVQKALSQCEDKIATEGRNQVSWSEELNIRKTLHKNVTTERATLQARVESAQENKKCACLLEHFQFLNAFHRRNLQRLLEDKKEKQKTILSKMEHSSRQLSNLVNRDVSQGLSSLQRLRDTNNYPGLYGPLYELFTVDDPKFEQAIEVTAENR